MAYAKEIVNAFTDPADALEVMPDITGPMEWVIASEDGSSARDFAIESCFDMLITTEQEETTSTVSRNLYQTLRKAGKSIRTDKGLYEMNSIDIQTLRDTEVSTFVATPTPASNLETVTYSLSNTLLKKVGEDTSTTSISVFAQARKLKTTE